MEARAGPSRWPSASKTRLTWRVEWSVSKTGLRPQTYSGIAPLKHQEYFLAAKKYSIPEVAWEEFPRDLLRHKVAEFCQHSVHIVVVRLWQHSFLLSTVDDDCWSNQSTAVGEEDKTFRRQIMIDVNTAEGNSHL